VRVAGGVGQAENIVLDGEGVAENFFKYVRESQGQLANFTITNTGRTAVVCDASTVTLDNVIFTAINTPIDGWYLPANGAAITLKNDAQVTANDCTFSQCTGTGTVVTSVADQNSNNNFYANGCTWSENNCDFGTIASTHEVAARLFLTRCIFENNGTKESTFTKDGYSGNAIFIWGRHGLPSTIQIDRCVFYNGQGGSTFGVSYLHGERSTVKNSLFVSDHSYRHMFHGYNWGVDVVNCTFVDSPGGFGGRQPHLGVNLQNCVIANCTNITAPPADDAAGTLMPDNVVLTNCIVFNTPDGVGYNVAASSNVITDDPLFMDDAGGDYHLRATSPGIDAGDNSFVTGETPLDLDGQPRIVDGDGDTELQVPPEGGEPVEMFESVDLGCYELQKPSLPGDANGDCKVNILDLIFIRNRLNQDVGTGDNYKADVTGDGKINILDLIFSRNHLNTVCEE